MLYASPAYEQIWGRTCQSLYDETDSWKDSIHSENRERVLAILENIPHTDKFDMSFRAVKPNGNIRWVYSHGFPIRNETGKIQSIVGFVEDVTVQTQTEIALDNRHRQQAAVVELGQHAFTGDKISSDGQGNPFNRKHLRCRDGNDIKTYT